MSHTYASHATPGPGSSVSGLSAVGALWAAFLAVLRPAAASAPAWRNVDAVDGLDERMLRDIGVAGWQAQREARTARDATQWRIDSGFG